MIISFSGAQGSGKTTTAKMLAKHLNYPRYYMGGLRREAAKKKGLTLGEYNKLGESDPSTDIEVDEMQKKMGQEQDNFIIEGRTSWYFIPHSIKIYLDVDPDEGARRIYSSLKEKEEKESRNEDKGLNSVQAVRESNDRRKESDNKRYRKYYDIDVYNPKNYDLYIDTTNLSAEETLKQILDFLANNKDK
jgi:predicted cytidylate kinase